MLLVLECGLYVCVSERVGKFIVLVVRVRLIFIGGESLSLDSWVLVMLSRSNKNIIIVIVVIGDQSVCLVSSILCPSIYSTDAINLENRRRLQAEAL